MKKTLYIASIIFTILALLLLIYPTIFFSMYLQSKSGSQTAGEVAGLVFFIIFDFIAILGSSVSFILNIMNLLKQKKPIAFIFFILATLLLFASIGMFIFVLVVK